MQLLIKRQAYILLSIAILTIFASCTKERVDTYFSFEQSELIVEVDENVTSFRIITVKEIVTTEIDSKIYRMNVKYCDGRELDNYTPTPLRVKLVTDTTKTTAKHNIHFINTGFEYSIGDFTLLEGDKSYRDVKIIPENITEEVVIYYDNNDSWSTYYRDKNGKTVTTIEAPANIINELKVILRPKESK